MLLPVLRQRHDTRSPVVCRRLKGTALTQATPQFDVVQQNQADGWIEMFEQVARIYGLGFSIEAARKAAAAYSLEDQAKYVQRLAQKFGLRVKLAQPSLDMMTSWRLPVIVQLKDGSVATVVAIDAQRNGAVVFAGDNGLKTTLAIDVLCAEATLAAIPRPARSTPDSRVDTYIAPHDESWFRRFALGDLRPYGYVLVASLIANALSLAGVIFSMQVYDRVVPANSMSTLYVLFAGVMLAVLFDFVVRKIRGSIIDILGKRCDLRLSDLIFGHALRVKNSVRPRSTGTFIAQLRDLEQVREVFTSTTVAAVADLPFFFLFLVIFWFVGGMLVVIPAVALVLLVLPGILSQRRLHQSASAAMREASLRNAILVESIQGIEDIKMLQAEERFQQKWNNYNAVNADAQLKMRVLTSSLTGWSHSVQTSVYAFIVFFGAPIVMAGDMTTGALVACSILGSRMMAPMAQLTQVLSRVQQAKIGLKSLDAIMQMPVDHPVAETRISISAIAGTYEFRSTAFHHAEPAGKPALVLRSLKIAAGDKIAVLGKNGAGKSTFLQALSGMIEPSSGEVMLDNIALRHIDPSDLRRDVGLLTQNSRLFHGTLRENVTLGASNASQSAILDALSIVGADEFIRALPKGLDYPLQEGGNGLSGGQLQALLLARLLVRDPNVVLLDEPTAAMDEATERLFIARFQTWSRDKTVVIATHRMRVLELVDRVMVFDKGQLVLDEAKADAMTTLKGIKPLAPEKTVPPKLVPVHNTSGGI